MVDVQTEVTTRSGGGLVFGVYVLKTCGPLQGYNNIALLQSAPLM